MPSFEDSKRALFGNLEPSSDVADPTGELLINFAKQEGISQNWGRDGWGPFDQVVMTRDGTQNFVKSVVNGKGVITGTESGMGNHRVALLRRGTSWADGEIVSLIYGPTTPIWNGTNAQQAHLHRVRYLSATEWEGIAVWTSIVFGGDYAYLHVAGVRFSADGALNSLKLSTGPPSSFGFNDVSYVERRIRVGKGRRAALGPNEYMGCDPPHLYGLANGDKVTVTGMTDNSFNVTDLAVSLVDREMGYFQIADGGLLVSDLLGGGKVVHAEGLYKQKRWTPFFLATRVVGGSINSITVQGKRWRPEEPEPDWGDDRVQIGEITPSSEIATLPVGEGLHGLWVAHLNGGSTAAWGNVVFRKISPALG